jgi:2-dehydropantoate 2-reductase
MVIHNIGIIGTGGVGGYFGGKLCQATCRDQNIFFLARGSHLQAIRKNGLSLKTASGENCICHPTLTADDINLFSEFDLCILSVKGFDLSDTLRALRGKTTAKTVFLPLLNGIDIDSQIHKVFPNHVVLPACVYISSHIEKPGVVVQTGGPCSIIFGRDPVHPMHSPNEIPELFKNAGINHQWLDDPTPKIWEKFIFIAPFSLVTACFDKTIGEVIGTPTLSRYVRAIMEEIVQLADKMGIRFPGNIITATFEKAKNFPENTRTSFQNDFAKPQKRDEREIFGGTILRLCKKERIRCDITAELYQKLNAIKPYCA